MNMKTVRAFFIAALAMNVLLVSLMLLDYFYDQSRFFAALLVCSGVLVILTASLMIAVMFEEQKKEPAPAPLPVAIVQAPVPAPIVAPAPIVVRPTVVSGLSSWDEPSGPFQFNGYTLYGRKVDLKGGGDRTIYFFSKRKPKSGSPSAKPANYHVGVNEETGLPFLKSGAGPDGEDLTPVHEAGLRPQCSALTGAGSQCRNSSRDGSKYCISHFGYQPPVIAKAEAQRRDTIARVKDAPDTLPSVRKAA